MNLSPITDAHLAGRLAQALDDIGADPQVVEECDITDVDDPRSTGYFLDLDGLIDSLTLLAAQIEADATKCADTDRRLAQIEADLRGVARLALSMVPTEVER